MSEVPPCPLPPEGRPGRLEPLPPSSWPHRDPATNFSWSELLLTFRFWVLQVGVVFSCVGSVGDTPDQLIQIRYWAFKAEVHLF